MASVQMEQLKELMKQMMVAGFAPKFDGSIDPYRIREVVQAAQDRMAVEPGITFVEKNYNGIEAEISVPENAKEDYIILYIHGGGLLCGNAKSSRGYASMLAGECGRKVVSLSYRLAPENPFPAGAEDCLSVYQAILEEFPDTPVYFIGESGGATLCLTTALMIRDQGLKAPAGLVPYSPVIEMFGELDRNFEGNEDFTVNPDFISFIGDVYLSKTGRGNAYAEPYYDDLHDLPPVFLAWDENETLSVDSEIILQKLQTQGTEVEAYPYPHCFHAFATAGRGTPESCEIMKNTIAFFEKHAK